MRLRPPRLAPAALAALLGCAGAPAPAESPGAPGAPGADPAAPSDGAPAPAAAQPAGDPVAAAQPAPAAAAPARAELPRATPPEPFTPAEQKELQAKCNPLVQAMTRGKKGPESKTPMDRLREVLASPPRMPPADLERCKGLLERSFRGMMFASIQVEAKVMLEAMGQRMVQSYQKTGAFCPSTDRPLPPDAEQVARAPYSSTPADWQTQTWRCIGMFTEGQTLHFQYEIKTDAAAKKFEIIARGSPEKDGRFIEIVLRGGVKDGKIEMASPRMNP